MSFNIQENKEKEEKEEKEEKKENTPLYKIQFEKEIQNISKIDKGINKRKCNNSFSYLPVFKDKEFFKNVNIQKVHTDNIKNQYKKYNISVISSLKYATDYNEKDIIKKGEYLIKYERNNSKEATDERNNRDIKRQFSIGKRNASSLKEKKRFYRNYIPKSELHKVNKKTENEQKTKVNIFTLKNKPQENQIYNYYYNNLKEFKESLPKFLEIKDDEKKLNKNEGLYIQINKNNNAKKKILQKTNNKQNNNFIKKEFKFSDELMIVKKNDCFLNNKNDNGNENPLFEDLSDKICRPIYSYDPIRNNLNYIINEPEQ